jgi:hypothetical protein
MLRVTESVFIILHLPLVQHISIQPVLDLDELFHSIIETLLHEKFRITLRSRITSKRRHTFIIRLITACLASSTFLRLYICRELSCRFARMHQQSVLLQTGTNRYSARFMSLMLPLPMGPHSSSVALLLDPPTANAPNIAIEPLPETTSARASEIAPSSSSRRVCKVVELSSRQTLWSSSSSCKNSAMSCCSCSLSEGEVVSCTRIWPLLPNTLAASDARAECFAFVS